MAGRRLTQNEIAVLKRVYRDQIDYTRVRIHDDHWTTRIRGVGAFVIGNNIQLGRAYMGDPGILIHEAGHVWQFQNQWGWRYFFNALGHHLRRFMDKHNPYDYSEVEGVLPWDEWNAEQQAQWIQDHECLPPREILDPGGS